MVPPRVQPEDLAIENMRQTRQRMPIIAMLTGKNPNNICECKTRHGMPVFGDVFIIIVVDEFEFVDTPKDPKNGYC